MSLMCAVLQGKHSSQTQHRYHSLMTGPDAEEAKIDKVLAQDMSWGEGAGGGEITHTHTLPHYHLQHIFTAPPKILHYFISLSDSRPRLSTATCETLQWSVQNIWRASVLVTQLQLFQGLLCSTKGPEITGEPRQWKLSPPLSSGERSRACVFFSRVLWKCVCWTAHFSSSPPAIVRQTGKKGLAVLRPKAAEPAARAKLLWGEWCPA